MPPRPQEQPPKKAEPTIVDDAFWEKDGFQRMNPEVFFWKPATEDGDRIVKHPLRGIVLARIERARTQRDEDDEKKTGKVKPPQFFYLIALTAPCTLNDHEKQPVQGEHGTIAWVDERFNLAPIKAMLPKLGDDGRPTVVREVGIVPIKKVPTSNGQNVWKVRLYRKDHEAAKAGVPLLTHDEAASMVKNAENVVQKAAETGASSAETGASSDEGTDKEIPF
jgi:hypothetical protein